MTKGSFVYHSMRILCSTVDFGAQLFDSLTPIDLSAFLHAFGVTLTKTQSRRYMQFWRQIFTTKSWMLWMVSRGIEVSFVGNDLSTMMDWVRHPGSMNKGRRKLYLDLSLVSPIASRKYPLLSDENYEVMVDEKNRNFEDFAGRNSFIQALQYGITATYSGLVMGHDYPDDRAMPCTWLDLTITSAVKHGKAFPSCYAGIRVDHSMSVGLWYGRRTMQRWCLLGARCDMATDTGMVLKMDGAPAMNMPMHIDLSDFGYITRVVKKDSNTGAYLFEQKRVLECTEVRMMRDKTLVPYENHIIAPYRCYTRGITVEELYRQRLL